MGEAALRARLPAETMLLRGWLWLALAVLGLGCVLPLAMLLLRGSEAGFAGLGAPSLRIAAWNSLWTAALTTLIVLPTGFGFAYALTRSCIPAKGLFRAVMLLPLLAPSLLPALALRALLPGESIHGPTGIILAQAFHGFPPAALILAVALSAADARLFEAAAVLKAGRARIFTTITLPGARHGLVAAAVVVFTLAMTEFGIPKIIGGQFPVLATELYRQVVGQQNMGAMVGLVLLVPAVGGFLADRWARAGTGGALLTGRAVPYRPQPRWRRDLPLLILCLLVTAALLALVGAALWAALPLAHDDFARLDPTGWQALWTSIRMAALVAAFGTTLVFLTAWTMERGAPGGWLPRVLRRLATAPLAVPGVVLGLASMLFFSDPANPFGFLQGSLALLVLSSVVLFYPVAQLTAVTAIRQLDPEFEAVGATLRVPPWVTFGRVTLPICLPAILDIAGYLFVSSMTTVAAVIFLYGPDTKPASVAVVLMDEAGQASAAATMAVMILAVTSSVKLAQVATTGLVARLTQRWRG